MNRLRSFVTIARGSCAPNPAGTRSIARWIAPTLKELVKRKDRAGPEPTAVRSAFLEWDRDAELHAFNARLSEKFDLELLARAFVFPSFYATERQSQMEVGLDDPSLDTGENTELVDAGRRTVCNVVLTYLSRSLPRAPGECVRALSNYLTSRDVLAEASAALGTRDLVLTSEHPASEDTLASAFLALVAALERSPDVDAKHVATFVRDFLIATLAGKEPTEIWRPDDPERILNEILSREGRPRAEPRLIGHAGLRTLLAVYRVALYSDKQLLGKAFGETIQEAKEAAAVDALNRMFGLGDSAKPIKYDLTLDTTTEQAMENLPLSKWCRRNIDELVRQ